jgi:hypothetical protein
MPNNPSRDSDIRNPKDEEIDDLGATPEEDDEIAADDEEFEDDDELEDEDVDEEEDVE